MLTSEHIDFIIKDLHHRGIILDDFQDELIDHVCSSVSEKMLTGAKFKDAYDEVILSFGDLQKTQNEIIVSKSKSFTMFKSYFVVALRNQLKQRFYSIINITGLAVGIASCIIIALFVINELSFDRHFVNAERIYRINTEIKFGANHPILASTSAGMLPAAAKDYAEIESWARIRRIWYLQFLLLPNGDLLKQNMVFMADSTLFKVLQFPILEGDSRAALVDGGSAVICRSLAEKLFPGKSALGETLLFRNKSQFKITAVFENLPVNTHFHPEIVISMTGDKDAESSSLVGGGDFNDYILLREGTRAVDLENKLDSFVDKYVAPQIGAVVGGDFTIQKYRESGDIWDYTLTPLTDIHLRSDRIGEIETNGSMSYVILLSGIGLLILGIACVNFINLSTARSSTRAREVGVRKVMGSLRSHLIRQFLVESTLLTMVAFVLSLVFAWLLLPYFNELAVQQLSIPFGDPMFYLLLFGASLSIGIAAGIYPSFFLSAFKPVKVLKGNVSPGMRSGMVRSSLVVFQFMISIFLIIGTIAIQRQLSYIQGRKLGFQKDQVLLVRDTWQLENQIREFKNEMLANSFVTAGTISGFMPVTGTWRNNDTYWPEGSPHDISKMVSLASWDIDDDYIKTLGMTVLQGRDFDSKQVSDSSAILINKAAAARLNFGNDPIGKKIIEIVGQNPDGTPNPNNTKAWTIIGVVEDFHFESMKEAIKPVAFFMRPSNGHIAFRFEASHTKDVIAAAEAAWKKISPDSPFAYSFLDEDFNKMYTAEVRLGKIFATFSGLAIMIACLGLFALTAFTAEQRTKEIGIRKVLGASVSGIVVLLSKEFGRLVLVAFVLAAPIAWYGIQKWLESYSYKTEVGVLVYLLVGVIALMIALLTMSFQAIKAAIANPIKALRNE